MARLEEPTTGTRVTLAARHLFGRSTACHSQLASTNVSGVHAELWWQGTGWMIQDLGSRNGTFVDGRRLCAGEEAALSLGATIAFGDRRQPWRLLDVEPPRLMAIDGDGNQVLGEYDLLCLPSTEVVEVTIYQDAARRWVAEHEADTTLLDDLDEVEAGGRSWCIHLPSPIVPTKTSEPQLDPRHSLANVDLLFTVSRDLENVELGWSMDGAIHSIQARAHGLLLLTLAQARVDDAAIEGLPEAEHGWRHREELLEMHKIDPALLNVWIHRARKQLAGAGFDGAAQLIERRALSQQLRLGTGAIRIIQH